MIISGNSSTCYIWPRSAQQLQLPFCKLEIRDVSILFSTALLCDKSQHNIDCTDTKQVKSCFLIKLLYLFIFIKSP